MHLCLLTTLFALTVCKGVITSSALKQTTVLTNVHRQTTLGTSTPTDVRSPTVKSTNTKRPQETVSPQVTTEVTSRPGSTSAPTSTSHQTRDTSQEPKSSSTPLAPNTNHSFTHEPAATTTSTNTSTTPINSTHSALSPGWNEGDLAANPGLVAIICIFCIVLVLGLVVLTVNCIRSPKANFERLDDVPMAKVNEESPFAQFSK